jgi:hypothetical protein
MQRRDVLGHAFVDCLQGAILIPRERLPETAVLCDSMLMLATASRADTHQLTTPACPDPRIDPFRH